MSTSPPTGPRHHYWPLAQLVLARLREFFREPEAMFWVYGFPILMIVVLGIAFRNKPVDTITVDVESGPAAQATVVALAKQPRFKAQISAPDVAAQRLRTARTDLVVVARSTPLEYEYRYDATRPESVLARNAVDDALERAAGRHDVAVARDVTHTEPGGRYIDFLVPGLLGMSLMGGGMWGVGYVTVDMRIRKLLKRFLATPMKKSQFLGGIMVSRLVFMVPEVLILLVFGWLAFGVVIHGSVLALLVFILVGAATFSGLGLLVASRARTAEAVSGLMNLVMLPMWMLSGIFFTSERFPAVFQPLIKVLPLTPLIDGLRSIMLEATPLSALGPQLLTLTTWAVASFALALRWFRWI